MRLEEYGKARAPLLEAIGFRDSVNEPETISYILMSLGSMWALTEKYEDAIAFFSDYLTRHPEDSAAYCGRAEALWYAGRLQEAIRDYSRALELKPSDIPSLSGRGQVLAEVGENGRAGVRFRSRVLEFHSRVLLQHAEHQRADGRTWCRCACSLEIFLNRFHVRFSSLRSHARRCVRFVNGFAVALQKALLVIID